MNFSVRPGMIALLLMLNACASAPVHYYTLVSPATEAPSTQQAAPFVIDVLPVGIPAQVDQEQLVVRQGDSSIAVLDDERWVAPLGDEVRVALSAGLVHRLGIQDVAGLARPAGKPVLRIKLQVRRLDAWPGRGVQLEADWSVRFADDAKDLHLTCHSELHEAAPAGYAGLVHAQQRAIAALADQIAGDARKWAQSRDSNCAPCA